MLFWSPDQLPGLYCYPDTHLLRRRSRLNMHEPAAQQQASCAFPLAARAAAVVEAVLEPGDVVFFPSRCSCCLLAGLGERTPAVMGSFGSSAGHALITHKASPPPHTCLPAAGGRTTRRASTFQCLSPAASRPPAQNDVAGGDDAVAARLCVTHPAPYTTQVAVSARPLACPVPACGVFITAGGSSCFKMGPPASPESKGRRQANQCGTTVRACSATTRMHKERGRAGGHQSKSPQGGKQ